LIPSQFSKRVRTLLFCLLIPTASVIAVRGKIIALQRSPSAQELIVGAVKIVQSTHSWRLAGRTVVERPDRPSPEHVDFRILASYPLLAARLDILDGPHLMTRICNRVQWTYFPDLHQMFIVPSPEMQSCQGLLGEWFGLQASLRDPVVKGVDRISIDGRKLICTVVQGELNAPASSPARGPRTLCVEPATHLILRYQAERTVTGDLPNSTIRMKETTTFTSIDRDPTMSDDLFAFHPPEGMKAVQPRPIVWPRDYPPR
jgi:hypothetical protein